MNARVKPKVLAFDVFGTVVDWHGSVSRAVDELDWMIIDDLHRMILDDVLEQFGVDVAEDTMHARDFLQLAEQFNQR